MPPVTTLPYGPAPGFAFPLFEISMYVLFLLCLRHAIKKGVGDVGYLIGGLGFGLLLEYVNVNTNMGYTYGKFNVMFGRAPLDVPLCIGVGWAIIMYSARLFTDSFRLPLWSSAAMDTLLAISIDLSMDTVAYRLNMWHWNWAGTGLNPLTAEWFGIPFGNFFGWVCVVFFYSSLSRLLQKWLITHDKINRFRLAVVPLLAIFVSQILLYVTLVYIDVYLNQHFGITAKHRFIVSLIVLSLVAVYGLNKKAGPSLYPPILTWLVPVFFHVYFFTLLFTGGFYRENGWMIVVPSVNLIICFCVHYREILNPRPLLNLRTA